MSDAAITSIAGVILAIIGLIGTYLTAWLKAKYGSEKFTQYREKAYEIVQAAEQIGAKFGWTGEEKYEYACEMLSNWTGVTADQARVLIEAAVKGMSGWITPLPVEPTE